MDKMLAKLAWSRADVDLNVAKNWGGKKVEASVLNHGVHKAKKNRGQKRKIWWQKHLERKAGKWGGEWGGDYQGDDEENKEDEEEGKAPPPVDPNHEPLGKKDGPDDDHHDDPGRTVDSAGSAGLPPPIHDPDSADEAEAPGLIMHGLGASVCSSCRYIYMPNCGDDAGSGDYTIQAGLGRGAAALAVFVSVQEPDFTDYVVEVAVAVVSFAGKMNGRSLGAVVAYKHAYVLPSLMGKPAAKKAMAKAKNGPKAAPKATPKELKKQEMEKAAKKKDQSNLVTTLKNAKTKLQGVQNGTIQVSDGELENLKNKAEFFDRYVSLDRNDPEKAQMLAAFLADKTCNNYMQKIREISTETKTEDEKASGFVTQWEIAAKENLPVDSPLLQKLLDGLKFDYDWNEAVPREKVFKEAGEKRFFYEKNAMTTEKTSFSSKSGITAAGDLGKKKADSFLNDKDTSTADPAAKVKIEFPLHVELVSSVKVLKSGKQKIQKELNTGKDLCQKLATGGGYDTTDLANAIDTFDNYLATLRQRIATAEEVQPPDVTKEVVAELKAEIDIADTHLDAFKRAMTKESELQRHARAAADMGIDRESLTGLGIWGDGVPMTRNRNQSLEMLSFNILTCQLRSTMRIPVFVIQKHWLARGGSTWDAVMDVLRWSLTCATSGQMPKYDHTGLQPLKEPWRKQRALIHTPRSVLLEIRGDWAFFKQVLNEASGCCWMCDIKPEDIREVSGEAAWMQPEHRKTPWQALMAAPSISPIFATPYVGTECIQMDWLHVVDIGIALQFLGSIMKYFCSKFEGTFDEQVREMFRCILEFYDVQAVEYRLDHLKPSMIKDPKKKFPKLRAKAGESRCLVPWAAQMADALRDADNEVEQTMYKCAWHFNKCYEQLSSRTFDAAVLAEHGVAFANLYVALHEHFTVQGVCLFKVTPKLHLFCEISYRGRDCPSVHWSYRDEDWGGKMAILAASKGGANTPNALANAFFSRFTSGHKVPVL
ncbi:unnamed protein product [Symbiodinium sp. CCMP2592]|nr:unnamed protein product [Symbiodinium sp. CCMP2592]